MSRYDMTWRQINTPIESSRFGRWVHRGFLKFSIRYLKRTIFIFEGTENRAYLADLKQELMETEGQLIRLEIQHVSR